MNSTAATRHLCAGAYVDREFRDLVIRKVHNAPHHRVAPSYEFDLVPVMRHAWWARGLETTLHVAIAASVLVPWLVGHRMAAVMVACGLALHWLMGREVRTIRKLARHQQTKLVGGGKRNRSRGSRRRTRPGSEYSGGSLLLKELRPRLKFASIVSVAVVLAALWIWNEIPSAAVLASVLLTGVAMVAATVDGIRQYRLNRVHRASSLRPASLSRREQIVATQQEHVCAVYPRSERNDDEDDDLVALSIYGAESPFVGSGELVHHWNPPMTVQMLRPETDENENLGEREYASPPFEAHELVDHLRSAIQRLDEDPEPVRLHERVRDRIYISETDASMDMDLLQSDPSAKEIREVINNQDGTRHHFLEVSVPAAKGEVVTTVLLRVSLRGRTLGLDFAGCALTQTPQEFQRIDRYAEHGKQAVLWAAVRALFRLPDEFARLYRLLGLPLLIAGAAWARKDHTLVPRRGVLIGTQVSVREEKSQEWGEVQLDKTSVLRDMKILERRLLNATQDFLESRKVDISEFENRALQIINSGIVNMGGNNEITNSAIGDNAQANNNSAGQQRSSGNQQRGGNA